MQHAERVLQKPMHPRVVHPLSGGVVAELVLIGEIQKLKQREIQLNQQQQELQRKKTETDNLKVNLDNQLAVLEDRKKEVDKLELKVRDTLEHVSGLSAEEAKEKLVESLKDEAKTAAASYINDIMDDAKLTANKEAKRIIVATIQRVATETAKA